MGLVPPFPAPWNVYCSSDESTACAKYCPWLEWCFSLQFFGNKSIVFVTGSYAGWKQLPLVLLVVAPCPRDLEKQLIISKWYLHFFHSNSHCEFHVVFHFWINTLWHIWAALIVVQLWCFKRGSRDLVLSAPLSRKAVCACRYLQYWLYRAWGSQELVQFWGRGSLPVIILRKAEIMLISVPTEGNLLTCGQGLRSAERYNGLVKCK